MFLFYLFYCWTNINISKDINVNANILPTLTFAIAKTAVVHIFQNISSNLPILKVAAKVLKDVKQSLCQTLQRVDTFALGKMPLTFTRVKLHWLSDSNCV